jgi:hypothetical protein
MSLLALFSWPGRMCAGLIVDLRRRGRKMWRRAAGFWTTAVYRFRYKMLSRTCLRQTHQPGRTLFANSDPYLRRKWVFHDEEWTRVRHRWFHRSLVRHGLPVDAGDEFQALTDEVRILDNGTMSFDGRAQTEDEWLYLYLDPDEFRWQASTWQFRVRRRTAFRELQFGFRYQDFYNRYRFRFEDERVFFDIVSRGEFHNDIDSAPFAMACDRWYDMKIDCLRNRFSCSVDGLRLLDVFDFHNTFTAGSMAIILWDDGGVVDIGLDVSDLRVRELVEREISPR